MSVTRKIQVRRGTATQWSTANPILSSGEFGYDTTNKVLKIGDGSTAWSSLAEAGLSEADIQDLIDTSLEDYATTADVNAAIVDAPRTQPTTPSTIWVDGETVKVTRPWLLAGAVWNDNGAWYDSQTWSDS